MTQNRYTLFILTTRDQELPMSVCVPIFTEDKGAVFRAMQELGIKKWSLYDEVLRKTVMRRP